MDVTTFLQLPFTKEFKLLAGENGLINQITGINILDNPNATDWLTPGELILTSGYFFKETPSAMANFLAHFDRLNIAAICIKPQIYLTPLPSALLEECNQRGIPLIEIPYGVAFSKILNTVMNLLSNEVNEANQMALDLNSELLEYGLQGKGIEELKGKLERLLGNPILITNGDWSVLTKTIDATFTPYLKQQQHHQLFDKKSFKHLPENFHHSKHPSNFLLNDQTSGTILPVFFNDITYGYMIVFQKNKALTRQDYLALEQTSITIALEIVHQNEKERIQNKVLRDFYRELLFGTHSIEELNTFNIEFDYDIPYTVFIIDFQIANHKEQSLVQQKYEEERMIRKTFAAATFFQHPLFPVIHLFKQGQAIIGLVGRKQANRPNEHLLEVEFFEAFHQYLLADLPKDSFMNFYIGTKQAIENIKESYREAKQILAYQETQKSQIYFARDFYFELFLRQHIQAEAAEGFIEHYLSPLLTWESGSHAYLLETLSVYLNHQLNLATASRDLFIHRNTLRYRIEKIEGLLGYSLDDPRVILSLQLALKLLEEYQKER